jgi:hypothetical protein
MLVTDHGLLYKAVYLVTVILVSGDHFGFYVLDLACINLQFFILKMINGLLDDYLLFMLFLHI